MICKENKESLEEINSSNPDIYSNTDLYNKSKEENNLIGIQTNNLNKKEIEKNDITYKKIKEKENKELENESKIILFNKKNILIENKSSKNEEITIEGSNKENENNLNKDNYINNSFPKYSKYKNNNNKNKYSSKNK